MPDIVYVFTNPSWPGCVKIGRTCNVERRLKTLNTGTPKPSECVFAVDVRRAVPALWRKLFTQPSHPIKCHPLRSLRDGRGTRRGDSTRVAR